MPFESHMSPGPARLRRRRYLALLIRERIIIFLRKLSRKAKPVNWRYLDGSDAAIAADVSYALSVAESYLAQIERHGMAISGRSILELGPGHNYGTMLALACHGAKVAVADRFSAHWQPHYHAIFHKALLVGIQAHWPGLDAKPVRNCIDNASWQGIVQFIPAGAENLSEVPDGAFDIVLSNAVLEHVQDPRQVAGELFRVTKAGGIGLHQVDFRDHRDFSAPLEYLLFAEDDFAEAFAGRHGECGQQTRHYEWRANLEDSGFEVMDFEPNQLASSEYLDQFLPKLRDSRSAYRSARREDLSVISGRFAVRRPKP